MLGEINQILEKVIKSRSLDHRECFSSVVPLPPDGAELRVECSDREALEEIERAVRDTIGPAAGKVTFVPLPDGSQTLPERFLTVTSVADIRRTPSHASELVTQVIYGDVLLPLKEEGDWILVRVDDGYIGWIRSWYVKQSSQEDAENFLKQADHRIAATVTQIFETPAQDGLPLTDAVIGTLVRSETCGTRGWRHVHLPDGRAGYAKARSLEPLKSCRSISRNSLSSVGLKFLGVPYLWGGNTPKGFDCSGLVQRIFKLHGLLMPRDSDMQARFGRPKRSGMTDSLSTGDLLFFGKSEGHITHVGMYLSDSLFLHAYGQVRINSVSRDHPLFEGKLVKDWRITRDPLGR
ncbi:MAG: C40 family peptidase [Candidatus Latescibacterota bacterium]